MSSRITPSAVRLCAAFLLGAACALWLLPVIAGPTVQRLRLERDAAQLKVGSLEGEVKRLKEAQQRRERAPAVKSVLVQLEGPDRRVVLEAEGRIQRMLTDQYAGRPIDDVSPFLLARRLQGTLLAIDGVRYQLDVDLVGVGPELSIYGVMKPLKPT